MIGGGAAADEVDSGRGMQWRAVVDLIVPGLLGGGGSIATRPEGGVGGSPTVVAV